MRFALFLWIGFLISAPAYAKAVATPCENEEKAGIVCRQAREQAEAFLKAAKSEGKPVIFVFGSSRCGPCLAWKKYFHENDSHLEVMYMPLYVYRKVGGRPAHDEGVVSACKKIVSEYAVSSADLDSYIRDIPACERKPTIYMVDPRSGSGIELQPGLARHESEKAVMNYLESVQKRLRPKDRGIPAPSLQEPATPVKSAG
jgi:hypothetical protein